MHSQHTQHRCLNTCSTNTVPHNIADEPGRLASCLLLCGTRQCTGQFIKRQLLSPESLPSLISGVVQNTLEKALEFITINIQKDLKIKVLSRKSEKEEIRIWLKF